jgi:predicted nucleic acid-binding protein
VFVLDTNVVSELRKVAIGKADPNVVTWAQTARAANFFLSVITVMEVEIGVLQIERRDKRQGSMLRVWLEQQILPQFQGRILPVDSAVAKRCAKLHVPNPQADRDALIAATGLVHGLVVATRNVADFRSSGVAVFNPWEAPAP